jgi:hypothetical protein
VNEVRRAARTEVAGGARRSRSIEPDGRDIVAAESRAGRRSRQALVYLLETDVGPFHGTRRMLAEAVDQPLPVRGDEGVIDGSAA